MASYSRMFSTSDLECSDAINAINKAILAANKLGLSGEIVISVQTESPGGGLNGTRVTLVTRREAEHRISEIDELVRELTKKADYLIVERAALFGQIQDQEAPIGFKKEAK